MNKSERKALALANAEKRLSAHLAELKAIGYIYNDIQPLEDIESIVHEVATKECNGEISEKLASQEYQTAENILKRYFGGKLPDGFFFNTDPRGYALKLKDGTGALSSKDWGSYEILAPDIKAEEMAWI